MLTMKIFVVKTKYLDECLISQLNLIFGLVWVEFNAPPDTVWVISEAVFTANRLTDTDKQNSTGKYR